MVSPRDVVPFPGQLPAVVGSTAPRSAGATSPIALTVVPSTGRSISPGARPLSASQIEAIRTAMQLFVDDDVARGVAVSNRIYCDACQRARPAAGFIQYGRYAVCNSCAIEYEVAHARGVISSPGQYVRDKNFGEADFYALPD
jgi:hypothetical protein